MFVCLLDELIRGFCYSDLTLETGAFELASTITLVLQANRLTKRASHPNFFKKLLTPLRNSYIHRKLLVLKSLFNSEYCEILKSTYFEEHLGTTASENVVMKLKK